MILSFTAQLRRIDHHKPVISAHKVGDDIITEEGPEEIHLIFGPWSLQLKPETFEKLGWKEGDVIEFSAQPLSQPPKKE